jgi:hypothetical protein
VAICLITGFATMCSSPVGATESPSALCENAADIATVRSNIPVNIMQAIALTETGRTIDGRLRPWPWVLNIGGDAVWFQSQADTLDHANELIASGITNFDIGCFQLNYRWHAANFDSLNSMLNPEINALYAAHYLTQKYSIAGSWGDAVGAYHSATVTYAHAYLARFLEIYNGLGDLQDQPNVTVMVPEETQHSPANRFPLLLPGKYGNGGSLVPTGGDVRPLFGEF